VYVTLKTVVLNSRVCKHWQFARTMTRRSSAITFRKNYQVVKVTVDSQQAHIREVSHLRQNSVQYIHKPYRKRNIFVLSAMF